VNATVSDEQAPRGTVNATTTDAAIAGTAQTHDPRKRRFQFLWINLLSDVAPAQAVRGWRCAFGPCHGRRTWRRQKRDEIGYLLGPTRSPEQHADSSQ
jgi:hypothetical protein